MKKSLVIVSFVVLAMVLVSNSWAKPSDTSSLKPNLDKLIHAAREMPKHEYWDKPAWRNDTVRKQMIRKLENLRSDEDEADISPAKMDSILRVFAKEPNVNIVEEDYNNDGKVDYTYNAADVSSYHYARNILNMEHFTPNKKRVIDAFFEHNDNNNDVHESAVESLDSWSAQDLAGEGRDLTDASADLLVEMIANASSDNGLRDGWIINELISLNLADKGIARVREEMAKAKPGKGNTSDVIRVIRNAFADSIDVTETGIDENEHRRRLEFVKFLRGEHPEMKESIPRDHVYRGAFESYMTSKGINSDAYSALAMLAQHVDKDGKVDVLEIYNEVIQNGTEVSVTPEQLAHAAYYIENQKEGNDIRERDLVETEIFEGQSPAKRDLTKFVFDNAKPGNGIVEGKIIDKIPSIQENDPIRMLLVKDFMLAANDLNKGPKKNWVIDDHDIEALLGGYWADNETPVSQRQYDLIQDLLAAKRKDPKANFSMTAAINLILRKEPTLDEMVAIRAQLAAVVALRDYDGERVNLGYHASRFYFRGRQIGVDPYAIYAFSLLNAKTREHKCFGSNGISEERLFRRGDIEQSFEEYPEEMEAANLCLAKKFGTSPLDIARKRVIPEPLQEAIERSATTEGESTRDGQ